MRVISTKAHGIIEIFVVTALLFAPNIFGFSDVGGAAVTIPRVVAVLIVGLALFTKYEFGLVKVISMVNHLRMDYLASLFLAASPWIFGFADEEANAWVPHLVAGLAYFGVSMMTVGSSPHETGGRKAEE